MLNRSKNAKSNYQIYDRNINTLHTIIKLHQLFDHMILFTHKKSFKNQYLHRYCVANVPEYLCYPGTLNAWKSFDINYNSIKYDLLMILMNCILSFKSCMTNINVLQSGFKKFHETEFRKLKNIITQFIFIILCMKHIIYSFTNSALSCRNNYWRWTKR
eukprot:91081_1